MVDMNRVSGFPKKVILISIIVPLLYWIPITAGYLNNKPPEKIFMGFTRGVDYILYSSFINQTRTENKFIFENQYTTEPQQNKNLFVYFVFLGQLAKLLKLSAIDIPVLWNIVGTAVEIFFFLSVWYLLKFFFENPRLRFIAFLFIAFSGGFGWIFALLGKFVHPFFAGIPADQVYNLGYSTFSGLWNPVWIAGMTTTIWMLICFFHYKNSRRSIYLLILGLLLILSWMVHIYSGIISYSVIYLILIYFVFFSKKNVSGLEKIQLAFLVLIPTGFTLWYVLWTKTDSLAVEGSKWIYSVLRLPIYYLPLGQGFIFILACLGIYNLFLKNKPESQIIALLWLLCGLLWSMNPLIAPFRFVLFMHIPECILATYGLDFLTHRYQKFQHFFSHKISLFLLILVLSLTNFGVIYLITARTLDTDVWYKSVTEINALKFLGKLGKGNILCGEKMCSRIPGFTRQKVFLGSYWATINRSKKREQVERFFDRTVPSNEKVRFLKNQNIKYVYFGKEEKNLGTLDPALRLERIFSLDGVDIYRVP